MTSSSSALFRIAIIAPPSPLRSTLHGLVEFFDQANRLGALLDSQPVTRGAAGTESDAAASSVASQAHRFETVVVASVDGEVPGGSCTHERPPRGSFSALIVSPAFGPPELAPLPAPLTRFLGRQARVCACLGSVCAGAFVLGAAGILDGHRVTTHWALAPELQRRYPEARVEPDELLVEDGQLMTAAGATAWLDLSLRIAARFGSVALASALGKFYLADTAPREQRCYRVFTPERSHGEGGITRAQALVDERFGEPLTVEELAAAAGMSLRNLQRRFKGATGLGPQPYLKRFRVQKACELLETSADSVERVIARVGYVDSSAFRKAFREVTGLSPSSYRKRFRLVRLPAQRAMSS